MPKVLNYDELAGEKFGELTLLGFDHDEWHYTPEHNHMRLWRYTRWHCSCGREVVLRDFKVRYTKLTCCGDPAKHPHIK